MSAGLSELLREAEYRNPGHMLYGHAAEIVDELCEALADTLPRNVCLTNKNVRDDTVVPLDYTMGELRRISALLAKARGEQVSA